MNITATATATKATPVLALTPAAQPPAPAQTATRQLKDIPEIEREQIISDLQIGYMTQKAIAEKFNTNSYVVQKLKRTADYRTKEAQQKAKTEKEAIKRAEALNKLQQLATIHPNVLSDLKYVSSTQINKICRLTKWKPDVLNHLTDGTFRFENLHYEYIDGKKASQWSKEFGINTYQIGKAIAEKHGVDTDSVNSVEEQWAPRRLAARLS